MGEIVSKFAWRELLLKDVQVIKSKKGTDLVFVDVVDTKTYESSGQYLYLPVDRNEEIPPVGTIVDVYTKPGQYQGRPSINFASIKASKPAAQTKVS
ncbi:hypothetical protein D3C74_186450 [compost metagenome]